MSASSAIVHNPPEGEGREFSWLRFILLINVHQDLTLNIKLNYFLPIHC